ncbi:MAG TPA: YihY/virulence factor BrkB family protein [Spirochaetota bacterium]|mgnify:CR=1 FL=1|nr:YihY/virulence factor BrkB family protein [Spirochaetota bacterium]HPI88888.1 YihY/virulence factor BrkB family protein [Spirochaetota bacterium]HPR46982.1 YihY/virulence factor BrkB family protein [Spirochaetota bacterium]
MIFFKYVKNFFIQIRLLFTRVLHRTCVFLFFDLKNVFKSYMEHDGELSTSAIAFFFLISFIPTSLIIISILSFFYNSGDMARMYLNQIRSQLPSIDINSLVVIIDRIVYKKRFLAFIWIPFLFWWGSLVFDILENALGRAFRIEESRKYWKAKIRHFVIILAMGIIAILFTIFSNFIAVVKNSEIVSFININFQNVPFIKDVLISIGNIPFILSSLTTLLVNTTLIFIMYRFVPPRKIDTVSIAKGALFASLSYEIIKIIFSYYITEINDYSSIFGSLNTIVVLMIWIWYTSFIFIIGAEMAWVFYQKNTAVENT